MAFSVLKPAFMFKKTRNLAQKRSVEMDTYNVIFKLTDNMKIT
jgi:hypothetical protein